MENAKKYFFGPLASSAEVMIFWGMHYTVLYRGQKFFFTMWGMVVSKDAEFNVDFNNINLYLRQNAPKKSKSRIKILFTTQGAPCVVNKIFILRA
jgi:hypothetical protein